MSVYDHELGIHERLQPVRAANERGVFASTGPNFTGSTFGRDSAEVGEDVIEFDPVIPREVLLTLASLQGLAYDDMTEEEPGKTHHLYRDFNDMLTDDNVQSYNLDSLRWGSVDGKMIFYGSIDATSLFLRLAVRHAESYGEGILYEKVVGRDGQERNFSDHLLMAKDWLLDNMQKSELGLIEFQHKNPLGEPVQTWKDSVDGYVHIDGSPINSSQPIAPLEVQGYTYDALKGIERLFPGSVPEGTAEGLARRTIEHFWLEEEGMFAQALDRDEEGRVRPVRTPTSSSGLLLDSDLLIDTPGTEEMVEKTITMLTSPAFLTKAGIRCRSLEYARLIEYPDYHGAYAVWFKETKDFIRGLERHGRKDQAALLARSVVEAVQELGEYYEFVFVDDEGNIVHPARQSGKFADPRCRIPEPGQAWTISAFVYCLRLVQQRN